MRDLSPLANLFHLHYAQIRALIAAKFARAPLEADDIVQDAFHNLARANNIHELANPQAYLYKTAFNLALNRLRQHKIQQAENQPGLSHLETEDELTPLRGILAQEELTQLADALNQLPEKYRQTFILSRVYDKTYKEISAELNIAESTVEKHIIKVLKCLREHLYEVTE
jgi:RNA polymerase sigma factor (sigma-70 family)